MGARSGYTDSVQFAACDQDLAGTLSHQPRATRSVAAEGENTLKSKNPPAPKPLPPPVEWLMLAGIVAVGAWLRFQHRELLEFKGDEAFAANRALEFVHGGKLPTSGLMSSVGVSNPPLFIWLLI